MTIKILRNCMRQHWSSKFQRLLFQGKSWAVKSFFYVLFFLWYWVLNRLYNVRGTLTSWWELWPSMLVLQPCILYPRNWRKSITSLMNMNPRTKLRKQWVNALKDQPFLTKYILVLILFSMNNWHSNHLCYPNTRAHIRHKKHTRLNLGEIPNLVKNEVSKCTIHVWVLRSQHEYLNKMKSSSD